MDKQITDMYNLVSNLMLKLPKSDDDFTLLREALREEDPTGESELCLDRVAGMVDAMQDFVAKYEYCKREKTEGILKFNKKTERFYLDSIEYGTFTCGNSIEVYLQDRDDDERQCWHFGSVEGRDNKEANAKGFSVNEYYFRCASAGNPALAEGMRVRVRK